MIENTDYIEYLLNLDVKNSKEMIGNSSTEHAVILIAKLIARARKSVKILTGSFNSAIYGQEEVLNAIGTYAIGRARNMQVIILKSESQLPVCDLISKNAVVVQLAARFGGAIYERIQFVRASAEDAAAMTSHFLVIDNVAFRFEADHTKHEAVASFNNATIAQPLNNLFDDLFCRGVPIELRHPLPA